MMIKSNRKFKFRFAFFTSLAMFGGLFFAAAATTTTPAQQSGSSATATSRIGVQSSGAGVPRLQLDSLEGLAARAKDVIDVELDGAILKMAASVVGKEESGDDAGERAAKASIRRALTNLKGVYVKGFEFSSAGQYTDANVAPVRAQLSGGGWKRLASVSSRKPDMPTNADSVEVYAINDSARSESLGGLAVLLTGEKSLMVVQITGTVDLEALSGIAGSFNIPQLKNLRAPAAPPAPAAPASPSAPLAPTPSSPSV
jgi:hypothetical protein